jgi:hypothetical protein
MLAVASLVGGFIDAILGGDGVSNAQNAENNWKDLLDNVMKSRGTSEMSRVDSERAKLPTFEADLSAQLTDYRAKADTLWPELAPLHNNVLAQITDRQARADTEFALVAPNNTIIDGEIAEQGVKSDAQWVAKDPHDATLVAEIAERAVKADALWAELTPLDTIIHTAITENTSRNDTELAHSEVLCTDDAFAKLCEFVACGYTPDYNGIADRARADAELAAVNAYDEACRIGKRYNIRRGQTAQLDVRLATLSASIGATAAAREKERQFAFSTNHDMRFKHATALEAARLGRRELALKYDDRRNQMATERYNRHQSTSMELDQQRAAMATERFGAHAQLSLALDQRRQAMATERWNAHAELSLKLDQAAVEMLRERWTAVANLYTTLDGKGDELSANQWQMFMKSAFQSLREGGEMLSAAAQGYQFLAASIRATAKQGGGGTGGVVGALATLATVLPMFSGKCGDVGLLGGLVPFMGRPEMCCTTV